MFAGIVIVLAMRLNAVDGVSTGTLSLQGVPDLVTEFGESVQFAPGVLCDVTPIFGDVVERAFVCYDASGREVARSRRAVVTTRWVSP